MSAHSLSILGTSSQLPTRDRNHSGFFVRWQQHGFLFDPGEGTQQHMLRYGVKASQITKIFISHFHGDHCLGLPGVIQRLSNDGVAHVVEVYYPASGEAFFQRLRYASHFHDRTNLCPCPISANGPVWQSERLAIYAERLEHNVECFGYRVEEKGKLSVDAEKAQRAGLSGPQIGALKQSGSLSVDGKVFKLRDFSIEKPGTVFAFVQDTRSCPAARRLLDNAHLAVLEATYLNAQDRPDETVSHMTIEEAAQLASQARVVAPVFTHFSTRYNDLEAFSQVATGIHPSALIAREGDVHDF